MTNTKNQTNLKTRNKRFSHIALAFALSAGTIGGMMAIASLSAPALARGNGGGGAGGTGGGEAGNVMAAVNIANVPNRRGRPAIFPRFRTNPCGQSAGMTGLGECKYVGPARVVWVY